MAERPSQEEIRRRVLEDRPSFTIPLEVPDPPATPRDSSTVILLRDGDRGLEAFMLERHLRSDFAGGAFVFPGGTIDDRDTDPGTFVQYIGADEQVIWLASNENVQGTLFRFDVSGVAAAR